MMASISSWGMRPSQGEPKGMEMEPEMAMECARWNMSQEKWTSRCADFATEASTRTATIITQVIERFELSDEEARHYFGTAMAQEGL